MCASLTFVSSICVALPFAPVAAIGFAFPVTLAIPLIVLVVSVPVPLPLPGLALALAFLIPVAVGVAVELALSLAVGHTIAIAIGCSLSITIYVAVAIPARFIISIGRNLSFPNPISATCAYRGTHTVADACHADAVRSSHSDLHRQTRAAHAHCKRNDRQQPRLRRQRQPCVHNRTRAGDAPHDERRLNRRPINQRSMRKPYPVEHFGHIQCVRVTRHDP